MTKFLIITLIILPWVIIPLAGIADPFRLPQATFLDLIFIGMICWSLFKGLRFNYHNKYLAWFALWVFITIFFSWYLPFTLSFNNRQAINLVTFAPTLHFILGLWATYIALAYFEEEDYLKIAKAICFSSVLITLFGIMQISGFDPFGRIATYNHPNHFSACLDNPNIVGNYLCLSMPLFLAMNEKKYILGGILIFAGILLSHSTLAIICAFIGLCFYTLLVYRSLKARILVSILVILFSLFCLTNKPFLKIESGFSHRLDNWKKAVEIIKVNPLFGQGLGKFKSYEIIDSTGTVVTSPHNDWLERTLELGALGLVLLLLIVFNAFRRFDYKKITPLSAAYLTSFLMFLLLMCGSFPVEIAPTVLLGLISYWAVERL